MRPFVRDLARRLAFTLLAKVLFLFVLKAFVTRPLALCARPFQIVFPDFAGLKMFVILI